MTMFSACRKLWPVALAPWSRQAIPRGLAPLSTGSSRLCSSNIDFNDLSAGSHEQPWRGKISQPGSGNKTYKWPLYNSVVYPPQKEGEEPRNGPGYLCHMRACSHYSRKKLWYVACMVRGLPVDEAIKQLKFLHLKGAIIVRETLEEAREMAVKEELIEFPTDLWVAESFVGKAMYIKGQWRRARGKMDIIRYGYVNYFVRLEEGEPPKNYYEWERNKRPEELLQEYIKQRRDEIIPLHA